MCGSGRNDPPPGPPREGKPRGNGRTLGRGPRPGSYSPPDPGGRGNGDNEPNRPWWTFNLAPRWARLALGVAIVVFGLVVPTGCASDPDGGRDLPGNVDTSIDDRCGETGECEGGAPAEPDVGTYLTAACTGYVNATDPGNWDLVPACVALIEAAPTEDVHVFLDRWLR